MSQQINSIFTAYLELDYPQFINHYEILTFLIQLERSHTDLYEIDKIFILNLINNLSVGEKMVIISQTNISPIVLKVFEETELEHFSEPQLHIKNFLMSTKMSYQAGFEYLARESSSFEYLRKTFLRSKFQSIRSLYEILLNYFPEKMYLSTKLPQIRLQYFLDPLVIPISVKYIRAYVPAYILYLKNRGHDIKQCENIEILLKLIFIEKILKEKPKAKYLLKIVHQLIFETPCLIGIIVQRGFRKDLVDKFVDNVPSFHLAYDLSLKMLVKMPTHEFYLALAAKLLRKYPLQSNIEKLKQCNLNREYLSQFEYLGLDLGSNTNV